MPRQRKNLVGALAVIAAGERAVRMEQRVSAAEKALAKAIKARADADASTWHWFARTLRSACRSRPRPQRR